MNAFIRLICNSINMMTVMIHFLFYRKECTETLCKVPVNYIYLIVDYLWFKHKQWYRFEWHFRSPSRYNGIIYSVSYTLHTLLFYLCIFLIFVLFPLYNCFVSVNMNLDMPFICNIDSIWLMFHYFVTDSRSKYSTGE